MTQAIRIANAGGYWGDDLSVLRRQLEGGALDVITIDYLAEITMSILQKQRSRNPKLGYAHDFVDQVREVLPLLVETGTKIITNAGGVNPYSCRDELLKIAEENSSPLRVGLVAGDEVLELLPTWHEQGEALANMDGGQDFAEATGKFSSANVYFGAAPVVEALKLDAQVIVTGRVTDTGISLAPMIHRFGWNWDDYDQLAAGIVAAHILECGAQSTGGNFTDWKRVPSFHDIGYPIVEMHPDGSFFVTKHEGTGGLVCVETVKEQLVYEMGDPSSYITPDVVAAFTSIKLEQAGKNRVRVWGIKGAPPTDTLKISASLREGYKANGAVIICGPQARAKGEAFAEILWKRLPEYQERLVEFVGADATWGPMSPTHDSSEIYLRMGVRDKSRPKILAFSKMLAALILSGPPGVAVTGGRPRVQEVVGYWPCLIPRSRCEAVVEVSDSADTERLEVSFGKGTGDGRCPVEAGVSEAEAPRPSGRLVRVPLHRLAHGRSGDKGDTSNIGVIARHPSIYPWLKGTLTEETVQQRFEGICQGGVKRFEVPNLHALNFLLFESLGGGGTFSLHIDAQGKTYAPALLAMEFEVDEALVSAADSTRGDKS